jgi:hypothetical protein
VTTTYGFDYELKKNYIITSTSQNQNTIIYPTKDVRFHLQTIWGQALPGAWVNATPSQTTLTNYSYVASLYGYQYQNVPLNTLLLNGSTDSKGDITFAMMADTQYAMNYSAPGYTFPTGTTITPHDDNYIIYANSIGSPFVTNGTSPAAQVTYSVPYARINLTTALIYINYTDVSGTTNGGYLNLTFVNSTTGSQNTSAATTDILYQSFTGNNTVNNITLIDQVTAQCPASTGTVYENGTGAGKKILCVNSTLVNDKSYFAEVNANNPGGNINEILPVAFAKVATAMNGIPQEWRLWFAVGVILLTALIGAPALQSGPAIAVVICFEGWILLAMGAFVSLGSDTTMIAPLTVATFMSFVYAFTNYRRQNK